MSTPTFPDKIKLFFSLIYKDEENFNTIKDQILIYFGECDQITDALNFDTTNYYEKEFGYPLKRRFIFIKNLCERDSLIDIKYKTYEIESKFKKNDQNRIVNIDPGFVSKENIILSTFKNYSHRIYLGKGVFAEITLIYKKNSYTALDWTYPDYKKEETIKIFNEIRKKF
jgi:hypothetical protein